MKIVRARREGVIPPTPEIGEPKEQSRGARVRVRATDPTRELRGLLGTITRSYGSPEYSAHEVQLDDGRSELFWHYQLEEAPER